MAARTIISLDLDDAAVRRKLAALGKDVEKLSSSSISTALPRIPQIPSSVSGSGSGLAEVQGRAQAQLVRAISAGTPGYTPGGASDPRIGQQVSTYLKTVFDPLVARLSTAEQGKYRNVAGFALGETSSLKSAEKKFGVDSALVASQTASGLTVLQKATKKAATTTAQVSTANEVYGKTLQEAAAAASTAARQQTAANAVVRKATQQTEASVAGGGGGGGLFGPGFDDPEDEQNPAAIAEKRLKAERFNRLVNEEYLAQITRGDKDPNKDDIADEAKDRADLERLDRERQRAYLAAVTPADITDTAKTDAGTKALQERIKAETQKELLADQAFIRSRAERIAAEDAITRGTQRELQALTTQSVIDDRAGLAVGQARLDRALQNSVLNQTTDQDLRDSASLNVRDSGQQNLLAKYQAEEALQSQFLRVRAERIVAEERLARAEEAELNQLRTPKDFKDEGKLQAQTERNNRAIEEARLRAFTKDDATGTARNRILEERNTRRTSNAYFDQLPDIDIRAEGRTRARRAEVDEQIVARSKEELAQSTKYLDARARRITAEQQIDNQTRQLVALNQQLIKAKADTVVAEQRAQRQTDRLVNQAQGPADFDAEAINTVTAARNKREIEARVLAATTPQDLTDTARNNVARKANSDRIALLESEEILQSRQMIEARGKRIASEKRLATATALESESARTPADLRAEGQLKNVKNRNASEVTLAALQAKTAADYAVEGKIAATRRSAQIQLQAAEFKELAQNKDFQKARAERIIAERQYIKEQRRTNAEVARQQGFGGTSIFSRFLARLGGGAAGGGIDGDSGGRYAGGIPPTLGEFFGGGLKNLARYALPGAAAYGVLGGLSSTIKEAEELDRVFASVEGQFDATFGAAGTSKFKAFREEILQIARDTGTSGEEIANIGFQLQGAFGNGVEVDGQSGEALRDNQLRAAAEIGKVTGLSAGEITDSLTAASLAFDESFRRIGDVTLDLQDRFGVLAKEIIPFLGDIAPVAKEAGFSLEEFATIAAVTQQKSGRSGAALAEAYGRVIPAIANARSELVALGSDQGLGDDFIKKVSGGEIRDVFFAIAENFTKLNKTGQDFIITLLGGRREASAILAAFNDSDGLVAAIEDTNNAGNLLEERFSRIQETVTQSLARLSENFRQLGVKVYEGGLGDALETLIDALTGVTTALGTLFDFFGTMNDFLGGFPVKVLAMVAVFKLLNATLTRTTQLGVVKGVSGAFASVQAGGALIGQRAQQLPPGVYGPPRPGTGIVGAATAPVSGVTAASLVLSTAAIGYTLLKQYANGRKEREREVIAKYQAMELDELEKTLKSTSTKSAYDFSGGGLKDAQSFFSRGVDKVFNGGAGESDFELLQKEIRSKKFAPLQTQYESVLDEGTLDAIGTALQNEDSEFFKALQSAVQEKFGGQDSVFGQVNGERLRKYITDPAIIQSIIDDANNGDIEAFNILNVIRGFGRLDNDAINAAFSKYDLDLKKVADAAKQAESETASQATLETKRSAYESGDLGITAFIDSLKERVADLETGIAAAKQAGLSVDKDVQKLNDLNREIEKTNAQSLTRLTDIRLGIIEVNAGQNTDVSGKAQVDELVGLLQNPEFTDLDERFKTAQQILQILQGLDEISTIPPEAREALTAVQLDSTDNKEFEAFANAYRVVYANFTDDMIRKLVLDVIFGRQTLAAVQADLAAKRAAAEAAYQPGDVSFLTDTPDLGKQLEDLTKSIAVPNVKTAGKASKSDAESAAKKLKDAYDDLARANVEGDPVRLAQLNLELADKAIAQAADEADRVRAMADRVRAVRTLESAQHDIGQAWLSYASAYYEFTGDTVAAAELAVQAAIDDRARVEALRAYGGAGDADVVKAAEAELRAKANLRDTQLQDQLDDYQFLYDMGKITKAQFIQYLETLKQIPELTEDQIRSLDRQIRSLTQEVGQDLQFNLPTKLALPTLYEVRRATQAGSTQAGFVDNRQVNIVLNVNNGTTQEQMVSLLEQTIGASSRYGTGARRY